MFAASPQSSTRPAAMPLRKFRPSPFYNMLADGNPAGKALALLHFTQRGNCKQNAHGFRTVTERARDATAGDATELTKENCYATVTLCTIEKGPDSSPTKDAAAMVVASKVVAPSKPQHHAADLYVEAMGVIQKHEFPVPSR